LPVHYEQLSVKKQAKSVAKSASNEFVSASLPNRLASLAICSAYQRKARKGLRGQGDGLSQKLALRKDLAAERKAEQRTVSICEIRV
jgi:hypothetical protein